MPKASHSHVTFVVINTRGRSACHVVSLGSSPLSQMTSSQVSTVVGVQGPLPAYSQPQHPGLHDPGKHQPTHGDLAHCLHGNCKRAGPQPCRTDVHPGKAAQVAERMAMGSNVRGPEDTGCSSLVLSHPPCHFLHWPRQDVSIRPIPQLKVPGQSPCPTV